MFAVIQAGGKQYKVAAGDLVDIEKIEGEVGSEIELSEVLMTGGDGAVKVGAPIVEGSKVSAKIVVQGKGHKVVILKHRARKKSRTKQGHRQLFTTVEITAIN